MDFLKMHILDISIINDCISLANTINKLDNMENPVFSIDDYAEHHNNALIYYSTKDGEIIGFIGVSIINDVEIELCGFVLPEYRNQKIASKLLEMVFDDYSDFSINIPVDSGNTLGQYFLKSYEAKYINTQCLMTLEKSDYTLTFDKLNVSISQNGDSIQYKAYLEDQEIGTAMIYGKEVFTIHHVEIYKEYRGHGYGISMLHTILSRQFAQGIKAILHVTKENTIAYNLYCKLGFTVSKELKYYSI